MTLQQEIEATRARLGIVPMIPNELPNWMVDHLIEFEAQHNPAFEWPETPEEREEIALQAIYRLVKVGGGSHWFERWGRCVDTLLPHYTGGQECLVAETNSFGDGPERLCKALGLSHYCHAASFHNPGTCIRVCIYRGPALEEDIEP